MEEQKLQKVLERFCDPVTGITLGDAQAVKSARVQDGRAQAQIMLGFPAKHHCARLESALRRHIKEATGIESVELEIHWQVLAHKVQGNLKPVKGISNVIAVASGKGGVGKSTTAVNLALALAREGARVGILDADIYGPSQPRMLGLSGERPKTTDDRHLVPLRAHDVSCMSIGFLIEEDQPMVWRGPMVTQALNQLLSETRWGELDYLVVDMPPGTGDIQLTLSQRVPVSGAVIVTTPQDIALLDARKGLNMFRKVSVNVLGIVENMSTHICSNCGHEEPIFGSDGGRRMAEEFDVPLLGQLPLDRQIREQTDSGRPTVIADPESEIGRAYQNFALKTAAVLSLAARNYSNRFPEIVVENS